MGHVFRCLGGMGTIGLVATADIYPADETWRLGTAAIQQFQRLLALGT